MNHDVLATPEIVEKTAAALRGKNYQAHVVADKTSALDKIKELIPSGASVMNGASVTLEQIGYIDYLKSGEHSWEDLHAEITAVNDDAKRKQLRREAVTSDFYLGSVHGLAENGEFIVASNTGSQLPHVVYTSPNLIFVVGTQKIVPTLADAINRLEEYVVPLEDKHMQDLYGVHTHISKLLLFKDESPMNNRTIHIILVNEQLGF